MKTIYSPPTNKEKLDIWNITLIRSKADGLIDIINKCCDNQYYKSLAIGNIEKSVTLATRGIGPAKL